MGNDHRDLLGCDVLAADGARLGHVADVYIDPSTGAPRWLAVPTGLLSSAVCFVPAEGAGRDEDGRIVIGYTRKQVRKAPHPAADGELTSAEEDALARHYLAAAAPAVTRSGVDPAFDPTVETDLSAAATIDAGQEDSTDQWLLPPEGVDPEAMVRAEEEVDVSTPIRPAQRARLVKRVVTEHVTFTVPVRREVLRLEYEDIGEDEVLAPVTEASEPFADAPDQEFVLYAEIVEYEKKIVPKERVRLRKEVVPTEIDLRTEVRKETVDVEGATTEPTYLPS